MHAGGNAHVGHAAIRHEIAEHRGDVADAIERVKRAAEALGVARCEWRG